MKSGHYRITIRLVIGFCLFLSIISALVGISISYLSTLESSVDEIVKKHNAQLVASLQMQYLVRHISVLVRNVLLLDDTIQREFELKRLNDAKKQYIEKREELKAKCNDDRSKAMFKKLIEDEVTTISLWDKVASLRISGKKKEATNLLINEVRFFQWKWLGDIDDFVEMEKEHVKHANIDAANLYKRARNTVTLWGLLAVILGTFISFVITKSISAPLEDKIHEEISKRREQEQILVYQSKLAKMGQLLVSISHHWRQPLNAVGLIVQDIQDAHENGELDTTYLKNSVKDAMEELKTMSDTINNFRDFYRPKEEKERFDLKKAVAEVLELLNPILKDNYIEFILTCHAHNETFTIPSEVTACNYSSIITYKQHFQYVILNILNNSKDAISEQRKCGLLGKDDSGIISIDFYKTVNMITINITDNGGGINRNILERIFEPYFTTKEQGKGIGQGLYVSKIITETYLDGRIDVENTKDGAVFKIMLRGDQ
ncbi:MAG: MCP four helix bundle domain-containing protein [Nitrospirae bacterium]|nr:MCP four helix bundle domain-containing protein [Nitrospirota bacterium]